MQSPKTISQKDKQKELEILEKSIEAERNFQKACEMAEGFPPPKSEEDFQFLEKWLFYDFFVSANKMNPETIEIPDCDLDTPVKKSLGKISFCLIPCLYNDEKLQVKLKTKFKIFAHQEDSFSLGITLPEEHIDFFKELEKHLNSAAIKMKKEIGKIGPSFARFQEGDFVLVKTDKSEQEKIYAKIYPSKIPTTDFSCRFWELCENRKKPILRQKELVNMPLRGQVVFSIKHLFCGNVKAITCIVEEVLVEEMVQAKSAFEEYEDKHEIQE